MRTSKSSWESTIKMCLFWCAEIEIHAYFVHLCTFCELPHEPWCESLDTLCCKPRKGAVADHHAMRAGLGAAPPQASSSRSSLVLGGGSLSPPYHMYLNVTPTQERIPLFFIQLLHSMVLCSHLVFLKRKKNVLVVLLSLEHTHMASAPIH